MLSGINPSGVPRNTPVLGRLCTLPKVPDSLDVSAALSVSAPEDGSEYDHIVKYCAWGLRFTFA